MSDKAQEQELVGPEQSGQAMTTGSSQALISMIERASTNPDVDVEKLERMWAMYDKERSRMAEQEFNAAMNRAQRRVRHVGADAHNKQTRSNYATYAKLDRALRPIYSEEGFSLSFDTGDAPAAEIVRVVCYVSHEGGHTRQYHVDMPADGKGAKGGDVMTKTHATGSAASYGMRYLLKMIFNVAIGEDDDDGNQASRPKITEDQAKEIEALMAEVNANEIKFLEYMKVTKVSDILARDYDDAIAALEKKRRKK